MARDSRLRITQPSLPRQKLPCAGVRRPCSSNHLHATRTAPPCPLRHSGAGTCRARVSDSDVRPHSFPPRPKTCPLVPILRRTPPALSLLLRPTPSEPG